MSEQQHAEETENIRNQIALLSIAEGFFESSVLFALLKLKIFEQMDDGSKAAEDLAANIGAEVGTLKRLLNAGVVLKILQSDDGVAYEIAPEFRLLLLPSAGENYLGDWIRNMDFFSLALSKLAEAVMNSAPTVDPAAHIGSSRKETFDFTLAMHNYAALRGRELASFLDTTNAKTLLDLGCGPGTYAFHLGARVPSLELYLLDLPGVLDVARSLESRFELKNKIHRLTGIRPPFRYNRLGRKRCLDR